MALELAGTVWAGGLALGDQENTYDSIYLDLADVDDGTHNDLTVPANKIYNNGLLTTFELNEDDKAVMVTSGLYAVSLDIQVTTNGNPGYVQAQIEVGSYLVQRQRLDVNQPDGTAFNTRHVMANLSNADATAKFSENGYTSLSLERLVPLSAGDQLILSAASKGGAGVLVDVRVEFMFRRLLTIA